MYYWIDVQKQLLTNPVIASHVIVETNTSSIQGQAFGFWEKERK